MKFVIAFMMILSVAHAATFTRVISKVTDTYQIRSGEAKLIESEFEVGTFNDVDGTATDIQTVNEKIKPSKLSVEGKLDKVVKISGNEKEAIAFKKISPEACTTSGDKKYCSTSFEIAF